MPDYLLRGLTFSLPLRSVRGALDQALSTGRYENQEAEALLAHLAPGDRFLDLGAGLGFLCALAARVLGDTAVAGIEAGPETITFASKNLAANGFGGVRLFEGAAIGVGTEDTEWGVEFGIRPAFWASAMQGPSGWPGNAQVIAVPAWPIATLLADFGPTVICCGIEGAEDEVLRQPLPGVRLVIVKFHPAVYGDKGVDRISDALILQGFEPDAKGSRGATVVFSRRLGDVQAP